MYTVPDLTRLTIVALGAFLLCLGAAPVWPGHGEPTYVLRFTDYHEGSIDDWLRGKGFRLKHDLQRRDRIALEASPEGLALEAKRPTFGIMPNDDVNLRDFRFIEIDWGVTRFPEGASYEHGVRNEALLVTVFMGEEDQPSGSMFIPDSPFFVGLFLCPDKDRLNHPYVGTYYKKGGRFVCAAKPAEGQTVTTRFDLFRAYKDFFEHEQERNPVVSGLALSVDTQKSDGQGRAAAFIREIRFYH